MYLAQKQGAPTNTGASDSRRKVAANKTAAARDSSRKAERKQTKAIHKQIKEKESGGSPPHSGPPLIRAVLPAGAYLRPSGHHAHHRSASGQDPPSSSKPSGQGFAMRDPANTAAKVHRPRSAGTQPQASGMCGQGIN